MVRGLLGLAGLWVLSFVLPLVKLNLLATFLHYTALFLSLSLIVVFQPELRKFMALMGNVQGLRRMLKGGGDISCSNLYTTMPDLVLSKSF